MKEKEIERLKRLKEFEDKLYADGIKYIAGIDEAGRGPLAGPVVIGCVIMDRDSFIEYVVVHELCHLLQPNHSRQFYDLVELLLPNWKSFESTKV